MPRLVVWEGPAPSDFLDFLLQMVTDRLSDQMKASEQAAGTPHPLWTEPWAHNETLYTPPQSGPKETLQSLLGGPETVCG